MRLLYLSICFFCLTVISCKKSNINPNSKIDYIPINSANTVRSVILGQNIESRVNLGFYEYSAKATFLGFEVKKTAASQYDIRAKAFYDNINYGISLPVVMTFDTTLSIQSTQLGRNILRFYNSSQLIQTDTVEVN